jgi:hypothetical protein
MGSIVLVGNPYVPDSPVEENRFQEIADRTSGVLGDARAAPSRAH